MIGADAALGRLGELILGAEVGPCGVIELEVPASGVVERLYRGPIGGGEVVEDVVMPAVGGALECVALEPEVEHGRGGDAELRHDPGRLGDGLEESEVIE